MGGGVEGPPVRGPAGPRFPSLPAATPPLKGRGLRPVRRWTKGGGGGGDYVWSIPWCPSLCPVCERPRRTAGGGAQAWAGRVGSGGRPRRRRRHAGAGPVAVARRSGRTGRRPAVALRAPLHGVGGRAGGGGGGLWAGGWVRARGGRGCSELSRRASPCGRPGGGAAGGGQSQPGSPGRSRCRRGRGRRWGPHPAQRGRIPPSIIHGGESWWRRGGAPRRPLAVEPDRDGPRRRDTGGAGGGPGPWWLWAGAGETGRASGLRLVRGGVEGPGGLGGEPREAPGGWARAPEGGRSLRGGGGCSLPGLRRGAAWCGAGAQPCGAAQRRSTAGPRQGAACGRGGARRGAAYGRGAGLRRGAAWGCAGAQRGAAHGRGMGLRRAQ